MIIGRHDEARCTVQCLVRTSRRRPDPVYELDAVEAIICAVSIPIDGLAFDVRRDERVFQAVDRHRSLGI